MQIGKYKGQEVKVHGSGNEFIIEFPNRATITMADVSEIDFSCYKQCVGCEEYTDKFCADNSGCTKLCKECDDKYDNRTGYCSLSCCLGYGCDQSC